MHNGPASNGHPKARLGGVANRAAVPARARAVSGLMAMRPLCRRLAAMPLWQVAVDGISRLRVDEIAVSHGVGKEDRQGEHD